ncbi:MAG: hypothetical protein N2483_10485, partial [Burkholderiaceae bacterium]|nr:hypothetical protein [Burkholderiaceae bacterium]
MGDRTVNLGQAKLLLVMLLLLVQAQAAHSAVVLAASDNQGSCKASTTGHAGGENAGVPTPATAQCVVRVRHPRALFSEFGRDALLWRPVRSGRAGAPVSESLIPMPMATSETELRQWISQGTGQGVLVVDDPALLGRALEACRRVDTTAAQRLVLVLLREEKEELPEIDLDTA